MSFSDSEPEETTELSTCTEEPIRLDGGGILDTFNKALASIVTTDRLNAKIDSCTEEKRRRSSPTEKKNEMTSPLWFPDRAVRSPTIEETRKINQAATFTESNDTVERCCENGSKSPEPIYDTFNEWVDGCCKLRFSPYSREAQAHISGWAMKYTNNHNKFVLKKTCVGVLLCSVDCTLPNGLKIVVRPAISDKVRERQIGQTCPNANCSGNLVHRKCTGNNGYPVTHFWIHQEDGIYFESKGTHDHFRPQARRAIPERTNGQKSISSSKQTASTLTNCNKRSSEEELCAEEKKIKKKRQVTRWLSLERSLNSENNFLNDCSPSQNYIKSYSLDEGNCHVSVMLPEMEQIVQRALSVNQSGMTSYGRMYLLCQTIRDILPGFNLLETRVISHGITGWPIVMATLYKEGTKDGIIQHMKIVTRLCSTAEDNVYSPKWQMVIHDFSREQSQLVVEAIVNMIINSQVQMLLKVFQYKSVSSLYKMLREKITGNLQCYDTHFELCKREIISRLQDPILTMKFGDLLKRLRSPKCTVQEYVSADYLFAGGMFGSIIREFWNFWGNNIVSPKVFTVAEAIRAARERGSDWTNTLREIKFPADLSELRVTHMSEIVLRWFDYQRRLSLPRLSIPHNGNNEKYPDSRVQDPLSQQSSQTPQEDRRLSAFHRPCRPPRPFSTIVRLPGVRYL